MTKVINFTGPHGSGKTTMRWEVVKYLREKGYSVNSGYVNVEESISRDAVKEGFVINEKTDFRSQYYIAAKSIESDLLTRLRAEVEKVDFVVLDRSVLDSVPYFMNSRNIDFVKQNVLESMLVRYFNYYPPDRVFYTASLGKPAFDGLRSDNEKFAKDIDTLFYDMWFGLGTDLATWGEKLYLLENMSIEDRLAMIVNKMEDLL